MTRTIRTILFFICMILFLLSALAVVFYSQGYRIDFEKKRIVQTGGLFFKVLPKGVKIYLDGNLKKKTDSLFGRAFIENLLPKKYTVEIKKEGFWPWEKVLEVKEREVIEGKNIVLIPESPKFLLLDQNVEDFFFSPDGKKIILKKTLPEGWKLILLEPEKNVQSLLIEETDNFLNLKWSSDSRMILLETSSNEKRKYYILELEKNPANAASLEFLGPNIQNLSFNPENPQKIFFTKNLTKADNKVSSNALFEADFITKKISQPIENNLLTFEVFKGSIFGISSKGDLLKIDPGRSSTGPEQLNLEPFPIKKEVNYQLTINPPIFLLKEGETFYLFDHDLKKFKKISEGIKDFKFSLDFQKIAYFNDNEIWVLFLKEQPGQPQRKAFDQVFLTRFSEKIDDVFWYTLHYLIFNTEDKIKIAEIDDRDKMNIVELVEFKKPKIFWNQNDKKLYVLSGGNLYISENLIK